jgi:hypothetical protein
MSEVVLRRFATAAVILRIMQIMVNIPDELAVAAEARGIRLESTIEQFLTERLLASGENERPQSAAEAVETILAIQKRNRLDGLNICDLFTAP